MKKKQCGNTISSKTTKKLVLLFGIVCLAAASSKAVADTYTTQEIYNYVPPAKGKTLRIGVAICDANKWNPSAEVKASRVFSLKLSPKDAEARAISSCYAKLGGGDHPSSLDHSQQIVRPLYPFTDHWVCYNNTQTGASLGNGFGVGSTKDTV